jgi:hypothetical protein
MFLTSCELYISLSQSDFVENQVHIHWALSYFKGGCVANFAERIIQQGMRTGKMCFASWDEFREEFTAVFCPENEATTALMRLESDRYFQGKRNIEAYIDEFKDLVNLSGYMDPIAIMLKFRRGLNPTTQDRIAESGTDRPQDRDFDGWFKAAHRLDPTASQMRPSIMLPDIPCTYTDDSLRSPTHPVLLPPLTPAHHRDPCSNAHPSRVLPPGVPMDVNRTRTLKPLAQTCYRYGQTGHTSRECNLHHDVRHMTLDEEDEFIQ